MCLGVKTHCWSHYQGGGFKFEGCVASNVVSNYHSYANESLNKTRFTENLGVCQCSRLSGLFTCIGRSLSHPTTKASHAHVARISRFDSNPVSQKHVLMLLSRMMHRGGSNGHLLLLTPTTMALRGEGGASGGSYRWVSSL